MNATRRPRLGAPTPVDLAFVWRRLSEPEQARVTDAARDAGLVVEMYLRQRFAAVRQALTERREPGTTT